MERRDKLLGKIILANFLEYGMEKFITFISEVEGLPLYKKLVRESSRSFNFIDVRGVG